MPGILKTVFVKEGQQVVKGQILATIDDGGMSEQLAQLKQTHSWQKLPMNVKKDYGLKKLDLKCNFFKQKLLLKHKLVR